MPFGGAPDWHGAAHFPLDSFHCGPDVKAEPCPGMFGAMAGIGAAMAGIGLPHHPQAPLYPALMQGKAPALSAPFHPPLGAAGLTPPGSPEQHVVPSGFMPSPSASAAPSMDLGPARQPRDPLVALLAPVARPQLASAGPTTTGDATHAGVRCASSVTAIASIADSLRRGCFEDLFGPSGDREEAAAPRPAPRAPPESDGELVVPTSPALAPPASPAPAEEAAGPVGEVQSADSVVRYTVDTRPRAREGLRTSRRVRVPTVMYEPAPEPARPKRARKPPGDSGALAARCKAKAGRGRAGRPAGQRRRSTHAQRRHSHNVSERMRRLDLKNDLMAMAQFVPAARDNDALHTGQILDCTVDFLRELQAQEKALLREKAALRRENTLLRRRRQQLAGAAP